MAEFVQTMKDWKRMCSAMEKLRPDDSCNGCRLEGYGCPAIYEDDSHVDYADVEKNVTAWAAEHPEPVYPRWVDWLVQAGVVGCETCHGHKHYYFTEDDMFEHIPEETAQLLGLKPLPVVHGDCGATNEADARKNLGIEPKDE